MTACVACASTNSDDDLQAKEDLLKHVEDGLKADAAVSVEDASAAELESSNALKERSEPFQNVVTERESRVE